MHAVSAGAERLNRSSVSVKVVVLTYAGEATIGACLDALAADDSHPFEVVVIDNAAVDASAQIAADHGVRVRPMEFNLGFAANNAEFGVLASPPADQCDIYVVLNDDAMVRPGFVGALVDRLASDPSLGAAQGLLMFHTRFAEVELPVHWAGSSLVAVEIDGVDHLEDVVGRGGIGPRPTGDCARPVRSHPARVLVPLEHRAQAILRNDRGDEFVVDAVPRQVVQNSGVALDDLGFGYDRGAYGTSPDWSEPFGACGGAVALRREFVAELGGFDPSLFLYYEDLDLSWRGRLAGWGMAMAPGAVADHHAGASVGHSSPLHRRLTGRNHLILVTRYAPLTVVGRAWRHEVSALIWHARNALRARATPTERRWSRGEVKLRGGYLLGAVRAGPQAVALRRTWRRRGRRSGTLPEIDSYVRHPADGRWAG